MGVLLTIFGLPVFAYTICVGVMAHHTRRKPIRVAIAILWGLGFPGYYLLQGMAIAACADWIPVGFTRYGVGMAGVLWIPTLVSYGTVATLLPKQRAPVALGFLAALLLEQVFFVCLTLGMVSHWLEEAFVVWPWFWIVPACAGMIVASVREHRRVKQDCPSCGYSLEGLPSLVCPECGSQTTAQ